MQYSAQPPPSGVGKDPLPGPPQPRTPRGPVLLPSQDPRVGGWGQGGLRRTLKEAELDASLSAHGSGTPARREGWDGVLGWRGW